MPNIATPCQMKGLQSSKWRDREASLRGFGFGLQTLCAVESFKGYLNELWIACSTLMDDVKESVREAATMVVEDLSKICVRNTLYHAATALVTLIALFLITACCPQTRLCDTSEVPVRSAKAVVDAILPFFLSDKGIENRYAPARARALATVKDVIKVAKGALFQWSAQLIRGFLHHMSDLERPELSTLQIHSDAQTGMYGTEGVSGDALAKLRLEAAAGRGGPWMELIRQCLQEMGAPKALGGEEGKEEEATKEEAIQRQYKALSETLKECMV